MIYTHSGQPLPSLCCNISCCLGWGPWCTAWRKGVEGAQSDPYSPCGWARAGRRSNATWISFSSPSTAAPVLSNGNCETWLFLINRCIKTFWTKWSVNRWILRSYWYMYSESRGQDILWTGEFFITSCNPWISRHIPTYLPSGFPLGDTQIRLTSLWLSWAIFAVSQVLPEMPVNSTATSLWLSYFCGLPGLARNARKQYSDVIMTELFLRSPRSCPKCP